MRSINHWEFIAPTFERVMEIQQENVNKVAETQATLRTQKALRLMKHVPLAMAIVFGLLWTIVFLFLGRLHAMWPMYDAEFPFLLSSMLGIHKETMSPVTGALFAFMDAALMTYILARLFRLFFLRREKILLRKKI